MNFSLSFINCVIIFTLVLCEFTFTTYSQPNKQNAPIDTFRSPVDTAKKGILHITDIFENVIPFEILINHETIVPSDTNGKIIIDLSEPTSPFSKIKATDKVTIQLQKCTDRRMYMDRLFYKKEDGGYKMMKSFFLSELFGENRFYLRWANLKFLPISEQHDN